MSSAIFGLAAVILASAIGLAGVLRTAKPAEHTADVVGLSALLDQMRAERSIDKQTIIELRDEVKRLKAEIAELKETIIEQYTSISRKEIPGNGPHT